MHFKKSERVPFQFLPSYTTATTSLKGTLSKGIQFCRPNVSRCLPQAPQDEPGVPAGGSRRGSRRERGAAARLQRGADWLRRGGPRQVVHAQPLPPGGSALLQLQGTTMMQEILWLLANDLDFEKARRVPQMKRFPFLEFSMFVHDGMIMQFLRENGADPGKLFPLTVFRRPGYEVLGKMRSPRFIKTHLPFSLLPPGLLDSGCKVVYMARNPKDVAVSYFHFIRLIRCMGYKGDFETYWNQFERNKLPWTPYWSHLKEGWDRRHHPNVMFIFYEDMLKDLSAVLERVARFVGRPVSEKQAEALKEYLRIDNFRRNPAVNMDFLKKAGLLASGEEPFIRRGAAGSSRSSLPVELERRADAWVRDNALRTGVELP
ncbi:sulfotransferase 1C4-like isoform X1 [Bacillus rossius redtenbacheri]|uniref:sulfotransferase 1C4-like isoform X1 n=1 Tax=Bacillus rossius redtenbacheri TaxID=93214 RepID=UPI002FDEAFEC